MATMDALANVQDTTVSTTPGVFASFFGPDPLNLLGVVILTSLGTWGLPQMVQKFYAIESEAVIKKGAIISTLFALIVAGGSYFHGGLGRLYSDVVDVETAGYDAIVPTMLSTLSPLLIGLVVILVLSASMSTLSSLVLASSSTLTIDVIRKHVIKDMDEKRQVRYMRVLIVIFIVISVILAIIQYKSSVTFIAQLMGISWGALAGAFLAPFLYGLYWKRVTKAACYVNIIFGAGIMVLNMTIRSAFPTLLQSPINCGAFAMLLGFVIVPVVSLLTKAPDESHVEDCFRCYQKTHMVKEKDYLESDN